MTRLWIHLISVLFVLGAVHPLWSAPQCGWVIRADFPHDSAAFTQGLIFYGGYLYESTGLYGESSLRKVELETGNVVLQFDLANEYFGEGLTLSEGRLIQLTWQSNTGFEYDPDTFLELGSFIYGLAGWGLTCDGESLIVSNGTSALHLWEPETYDETGLIAVKEGVAPVDGLNELESINGEIWANILGDDRIARIDPANGQIIAWIDLAALRDDLPSSAGVLNGIAHDADQHRLFVTGKNWPKLYEIVVYDCPGMPLFGDGFESGNTDFWSQSADRRRSPMNTSSSVYSSS